MAAKTKSSKPGKTVIVLTDQKNPPDCTEAQIGGTAVWECGNPDYPEFYLTFGESNPFNGRKNAKFKGSKDQPLTLLYKNAGSFQLQVTHISKKDGSQIERGPFCITVIRPPTHFFAPPHGCPPFCGGSAPLG
ncbi:MAG: hypothetical protein WAK33_02690 [Silvibacterium sp.]